MVVDVVRPHDPAGSISLAVNSVACAAGDPSYCHRLPSRRRAQPRAVSGLLLIRTRAAAALSSSDIVLTQPARTSPTRHTEAIRLVLTVPPSARSGHGVGPTLKVHEEGIGVANFSKIYSVRVTARPGPSVGLSPHDVDSHPSRVSAVLVTILCNLRNRLCSGCVKRPFYLRQDAHLSPWQ